MSCVSLPTPAQMISHLDLFVQGQLRAKRSVCASVYAHYLAIAAHEGNPSACHSAPPHVLLAGPTGCGKSYMIKVLARHLGVPFLHANAASLTASGYVGESVSDLLARLAAICAHDQSRMRRAILFLDEFDKLARHNGEGADVRGDMVQHELLLLLDGHRFTRQKESDHRAVFDVDTSKILVVACGAFSELDAIVERRLGKQRLGFGDASPGSAQSEEIANDDLVTYGFIPELAGRFRTIVRLEALSRDDLSAILTERKGSPIARERELFGLHGIDLSFTPAAVSQIAGRALTSGSGARALDRLIGAALCGVEWRLPDLAGEGVREVCVDDLAAAGRGEPTLVRGPARDAEPAAEALRREVFSSRADASSGAWMTEGFQRAGEPPRQGVSDTRGWGDAEIVSKLEEVKLNIGWNRASLTAKHWWLLIEGENRARPGLALRLAEELKVRGSSIDELYLSYTRSSSENILANLHLLDFVRAVKALASGERIWFPDFPVPSNGGWPRDELRGATRAIVGARCASRRAFQWWLAVERHYNDAPESLFGLAETLAKEGISLEELSQSATLAGCEQPEAALCFARYLRCAGRQELSDSKARLGQARVGAPLSPEDDEKHLYLTRVAESFLDAKLGLPASTPSEPRVCGSLEQELDGWCRALLAFRGRILPHIVSSVIERIAPLLGSPDRLQEIYRKIVMASRGGADPGEIMLALKIASSRCSGSGGCPRCAPPKEEVASKKALTPGPASSAPLG